MNTAITALGASADPLSTDWCKQFADNASDDLGRIIRLATLQSIDADLDGQLRKLEELQALYTEAVRLNTLRLDTWPVEYHEKQQAIITSQGVILAGLQQLGFFGTGSAENLYREAGLSPKEELSKFEVALREMAVVLAAGDVDQGKRLESGVSEYQQRIPDLITSSELVVSGYAVTRTTLHTDAENAGIKAEVQRPLVQNAAHAYSDFSQQYALEESGLGTSATTLTGAYQNAERLISAANTSRAAADRLMNQGAVLQAGQQNSGADRDLKEAVRIQGVIDLGITTLGEKVTTVLADINALIELRNSAVPSANMDGVRSNTRNLIRTLGDELTSCSNAVESEPYETDADLEEIRTELQKAIAMIQMDIDLLDSINREMASAALFVPNANTAIADAQNVSFAHSVVDLSSANTALSSYISAATQVALLVTAEDYEAALDVANGANVNIQSVPGLVSAAISLAEQDNQTEIDRLAKIEADRLQAIKDAKEQDRLANLATETDFSATEDDDSDDEPDFSATED